MNWAGFNCSLPHKVAVIQHLDGLGNRPKIMGAVNCVVRRGASYIGENTDGKGFLASLREVVDPAGRSVVMFGAGGAARAVSVELALAGASGDHRRQSRSGARAGAVVDLAQPAHGHAAELVEWASTYRVPDGTDIVINATSIGLFPDVDAPARPRCRARSRRAWSWLTSSPIRRARGWSSTRRQRGCKVIDGLGMLVNQGVIGVKYWTGVDVDPAVMRRTIADLFGV